MHFVKNSKAEGRIVTNITIKGLGMVVLGIILSLILLPFSLVWVITQWSADKIMDFFGAIERFS